MLDVGGDEVSIESLPKFMIENHIAAVRAYLKSEENTEDFISWMTEYPYCDVRDYLQENPDDFARWLVKNGYAGNIYED